jgi:hypothetical protein
MERVCLSDIPTFNICPKINGTSSRNCSAIFAIDDSAFFDVKLTPSLQHFYGHFVSTASEACLQVVGVENGSCNSSSFLAACQNLQSSNVSECPMRLATDGSCQSINDTLTFNFSSIADWSGGCFVIENTLAFGCSDSLTRNCTLGNGTASFNCSAICSTPGLLLENYYTYEKCAPSSRSLNGFGMQMTLDAANSTLPLINACMEQYCEAPFEGLGGYCPWSNITSNDEYIGSLCAGIKTAVDLDLAGVGVSTGSTASAFLARLLIHSRFSLRI